MRRTRTRRRSRGQALVEFALILPVFVLTFFGTVEFSLIMASLGSYNFAVRDATRLGTVLGRSTTTVDTQMINLALSHISGIVMATPSEFDIYRATSDGKCLDSPNAVPATVPGGTAQEVSIDAATCAKGVYTLVGGTWTLTAGTGWSVNDRNDSLESADYLGMRVLYQYTFVTGLVGAVGTFLNLSATSAQRIEPQDFKAAQVMPPHVAPMAVSPLAAVFGRNGAGA